MMVDWLIQITCDIQDRGKPLMKKKWVLDINENEKSIMSDVCYYLFKENLCLLVDVVVVSGFSEHAARNIKADWELTKFH